MNTLFKQTYLCCVSYPNASFLSQHTKGFGFVFSSQSASLESVSPSIVPEQKDVNPMLEF